MRIAVFSDSHGDLIPMRRMTGQLAPYAVFHLGDCTRDAEQLRRDFPDIPVYSVAGNNDPDSASPLTMPLTLEGVRLVLTHGHIYGVHSGLERLRQFALAQGAQAALFGHTHRAFSEQRGGIWLLNPGKAGRGLFSMSPGTCGLLTLEQGRLSWELIEIPSADG